MQDTKVERFELPNFRKFDFYRSWETWALQSQPVLQIRLRIEVKLYPLR